MKEMSTTQTRFKMLCSKKKKPMMIRHINKLKTIILKDRQNRITNPMYERFESEEHTLTALNNWMNFDGIPMESRYVLLRDNLSNSINAKKLKTKTCLKEYDVKEQFRKYYSTNSHFLDSSFK